MFQKTIDFILFLQFKIIINIIISSFYLRYAAKVVINVFLSQRGDRLKTSQSDVYRRQILTSKVGPRAVMVNTALT